MDLSIVIPLINERESLPELVSRLHAVIGGMNKAYEILLIDDGSRDGSWEEIERLHQQDPRVKGIRLGRNYGKSPALNEGFKEASGKVVITMDADLQDDPVEIPRLLAELDKGLDLVSGWKVKRLDPITKTLPSKLFNMVTSSVAGVKLHDFNCGLKAYRRDVIKAIEVFGEMHRYIPFIAKKEGFHRIGEKEVKHHARKYGKTKFGLNRFINGFLDLLTITFVFRFGKKPMHFFGAMGTLMFFLGSMSILWLLGDKLWHVYHHERARLVADNPIFFIALTVMIIGSQLFLAGFVAELVARNSPERNAYRVDRRLGL